MTFTWNERRHVEVDIGQIVSEVIACRKLGATDDDEIIDNCLAYGIPDDTPTEVYQRIVKAVKNGLNGLPQRDFQKEFMKLLEDAQANGWTPTWYNPLGDIFPCSQQELDVSHVSDYFELVPPSKEQE